MRTLASVSFLACLLATLCLLTGGGKTAADDKKIDVQVGDIAPTVAATDDRGLPWKSADRVGKKYLVVYFYPGDFTPGCIRQAQNFRDDMNKLHEQGIEVVGVSGDSVTTHTLFKKAQKLNFTLLADEEGSLAKRFGVPVGAGGKVRAKDPDGKDRD